MKIYYFGCYKEAGHYMRAPGAYGASAKGAYEFTRSSPWGYSVDGGLCPRGKQIEGRALVHHKGGWTALSFWDRSVDSRGGCNSNFLAEGTFDFSQMVALAREHFPEIVRRYSFPIVGATDHATAETT